MPAPLYPFDPTGTAPSNLVGSPTPEMWTIAATAGPNMNYIIPNAAPFFANSLVVQQFVGGVGSPMVEGVDYILILKDSAATVSLETPVYGAIAIINSAWSGTVGMTYQTVGGNWVLADNEIVEALITDTYNGNPRIVYWDQVDGLPTQFPPGPHENPLSTLKGTEDLIAAIQDITSAVVAGFASPSTATALLTAHELNTNPAAHLPSNVGLGNVQNFGVASQSDAQNGISNTLYMTPLSVTQLMPYFTSGRANQLATARNIALGGVLTGSAAFDGSGDITITAAYQTDPYAVTWSTLSGVPGDLVSGTLNLARIPALPGSIIGSGTVDLARLPLIPANYISGVLSAGQLPSIPASQISGVLAIGNIPAIPVSDITGLNNTSVGLGNVTNDAQVPLAQKGAANGVASLDDAGYLITSQLPASGVTAGTYGDSSHTVSITVDGTGRVTSVTQSSISGGSYIPTSAEGAAGGVATLDGSGHLVQGIDGSKVVSGTINASFLPYIPAAIVTGLTNASVGLGNVTNDAQVPLTQKAAAGGVATLDSGGQVPLSQLGNVPGAGVSPGTLIDIQVYETIGGYTWNRPAGMTAGGFCIVEGIGGGGSGANGSNPSVSYFALGGGGSSGAYGKFLLPASAMVGITTMGITVGGGAAAATTLGVGNMGNPSVVSVGAHSINFAAGYFGPLANSFTSGFGNAEDSQGANGTQALCDVPGYLLLAGRNNGYQARTGAVAENMGSWLKITMGQGEPSQWPGCSNAMPDRWYQSASPTTPFSSSGPNADKWPGGGGDGSTCFATTGTQASQAGFDGKVVIYTYA